MNVRLLSLGIQCIRSRMVTCNEDPILAHQVETKEKENNTYEIQLKTYETQLKTIKSAEKLLKTIKTTN